MNDRKKDPKRIIKQDEKASLESEKYGMRFSMIMIH